MSNRSRSLLLVLPLAGIAAGGPHADAATRSASGLTIAADESRAHPGGLVDVRVRSPRPVRGQVLAVLDGRRIAAFPAAGELRALVPIPVTHWPGRTTLGIEVRSARGRQRIPVPITITERVYAARSTVIPEPKRTAIETPAATRDGRELLQLLRTVTPETRWRGPFRPPVDVAPDMTFGARQTYVGAQGVEARIDAVWGEYHRGLDYRVPAGTPVRAPAHGTVLFAGPLTLSGRSLVLDHGRGLVSVFYHLDRADVRLGEWVPQGATIGAAGETGIADAPHLHWGTYLHAVAIDPRLTFTLD